MKSSEKDLFNQKFKEQEKLESYVSIRDFTILNCDSHAARNIEILMNGNPKPKLDAVNSQLDEALTFFENGIAKQRSNNAKEIIEINGLRVESDKISSGILQKQKFFDSKKTELESIDFKLKESNKIFEANQLQLEKTKKEKLSMVESMTPKQRSFILQKAIKMQDEGIIKLIINFDLDADFRNGSGESLMQTASQFENKVVMDKLKPLASKESYHPPKKLIELEQVNLKTDVLNKLSEGLAEKNTELKEVKLAILGLERNIWKYKAYSKYKFLPSYDDFIKIICDEITEYNNFYNHMPHLLKYNKEGFIKGRYEDLEYWRKDAIEQGLDLKTSFTDYSRIVPSNYTGPNTRKGAYDPYVTVQKWVDLVGFEGYVYPLQGKMSNNQLANAQLDFKRKTIESEKELTELKLKQVELQDNYVNEVKLMTPTECSFLLQKALFIQAECIIKLMENIELDADFRNDEGVSLVQTANRPCSKALYGFIMDKLKPLASEESYHPLKKVVKNTVPIPKIETNLASVQKDKDILSEFVGQMNNTNLGNAQEVKDEVKSTGEYAEDYY